MFALDREEEPYSDEFERLDFKKKTVLAGSGFFIPIIILGIIPVLFSFCLSYCSKKYRKIAYFKAKIDDIFKWNYTLRSLFETTLDIGILAIIETYVLNFNTWGYKLSFGFAILFFASLLGLVLLIRCYVRRVDMDDENIVNRVGTLYDGLIPKK